MLSTGEIKSIKKRWLILGVFGCLWLGPAGVAAIISLIKLTSVPTEEAAQLQAQQTDLTL